MSRRLSTLAESMRHSSAKRAKTAHSLDKRVDRLKALERYDDSIIVLTSDHGDAYGEEFVGDAFIGDAGSNLVHRKKLRPDGILLRAERPADEQKVEFLASTDNWFRPVQFANAPDGCLYIADMYREVIEHPWSLPANLKKHLDLNSGNDRGRIYRVVPENFKQRPPSSLGKASTAELVKLLEHPNGWHRDTAARLIYERQDKLTVFKAQTLLERSEAAIARLHALYVLKSLGSLGATEITLACSDVDAAVRQHAVRLVETSDFRNDPLPPMHRLAADLDSLVRFEVALNIGGWAAPNPGEDLEAHWMSWLLKEKQDYAWFRAAILNGAGEHALALFQDIARGLMDPGQPTNSDHAAIDEDLARLIGAQNKSNAVAAVVNQFHGADRVKQNPRLLAGLFDGLRQGGVSVENTITSPRFGEIVSAARQLAGDKAAREEDRLAAIRLVGFGDYPQTKEFLSSLLKPDHSQKLQLAAIGALDAYGDAGVGRDLLVAWPNVAGRVREEILKVVLKRMDRIRALLEAINSGSIRHEDLSLLQESQLRSHRDPAIHELAMKVLGRSPTSARQSVVAAYQTALSLTGNREPGQSIFQARCASCHKLGSEGHTLGPDLATVKSGGKEKLLIAILDPNREVAPNFAGYTLDTKDGESFTGILASENAASVTLRMAGGTESVIARGNIASLQSQGRSLMPEGLEEGLKPQDLADLLEFIIGK